MRVFLGAPDGTKSVYEVSTFYDGPYTVMGTDCNGNEGVELIDVPWAIYGTVTGSTDEFMIVMHPSETDDLMLSAFHGDVDLREFADRTFYNPDEVDVSDILEIIEDMNYDN